MRLRLPALFLVAPLLAAAVTAAPQPPAKGKTPAPKEEYPVHPDTQPQDGVPKGTLTKQTEWKSEVFKGTTRDWWIYVPAQYKPDGPAACVMVFRTAPVTSSRRAACRSSSTTSSTRARCR